MVESTLNTADAPLVSVIMPVYNAELYLEESINSILDQTYQHFELLIYNDGSTDNSATIIRASADKDSRIVVFDGPNLGLVAQLNNGLRQAQGKYIARMDADDIAPLERLAKQVGYLEANPQVGLCGGAVRMFSEGAETIVHLPEKDEVIRAMLCLQNPFFHPAVTMRRSVLLTYSLWYREEYMTAEDYQLWCEMSRVTQLHNLPEIMLHYRIHSTQVTRVQSARGQQTTARIRREQMVELGITLSAEQEIAFDLLNADRNHPHLQLADYKKIGALIQQLYTQLQSSPEIASVAYETLNIQWYSILRAAARFRPHLLPILLHHPLGDKTLTKVNITLAIKYLINWRPNMPRYLKRYWRQRFRRIGIR